MRLLNYYIYFKSLLLCIILITFSISIIPQKSYAIDVNIADAAFVARIEKIVKKLLKSEKKGSSQSYIKSLLNLKSEIETYYNTNLNLNSYLDEVENQVRKSGYRFEKKQFKSIKKLFSKNDKKRKAKPSKEDKKDKEELEVPVQLVYGVTVTLVGFFLMILPIPGCKPWGEKIAMMGVGICGNCICNKEQQNRDEKKDEK